MNYDTPAVLSVGFGREKITPAESMPMAGYGDSDNRMSQGVLNDLFTTCIAFSDSAGNTCLQFHNDLINTPKLLFLPIRETVSQATGIPVEHILVSATHTHSGPELYYSSHSSVTRYLEFLSQWMTKAAIAALADRKPAKMYIGTTFTKSLNFVRHYIMNDGSICGDAFGDSTDKTYVGHTTEADPTMQLIHFTREGGRDILLCNWQTHPHRASGTQRNYFASDIIGVMREVLEENQNCLFAYFSGGSGNLNPKSRIQAENITADYLEQGNALADCALSALANTTPVNTGHIRFQHLVYRGKLDHTQDHLVPQAKEIQKLWGETFDLRQCIQSGKPYGIHSPFHAGAILSKAKAPDYLDVDMYAFSIGDVAFINAPYEMFDANGKQIRDGSPFAMTFIVTCANDSVSYIPSALGYFHGCYGADTGKFHPGTGEELAQTYVSMLKNLYETK